MKKTLREIAKLFSKIVDTITKDFFIGMVILVLFASVAAIIYAIYGFFEKVISDPFLRTFMIIGMIIVALIGFYQKGKKYREEDDE